MDDLGRSLPVHLVHLPTSQPKVLSLIQNGITNMGIDKLVVSQRKVAALNAVPMTYQIDRWACCDQRHTGRCWIFAGMTVLRAAIMKAHPQLKDFELSQAYPFFFDKLERASLFLHQVI